MEVPKNYQLSNVVDYLVSTTEFSQEGIDYAIKTIFENVDLLEALDSTILSRIQVKLIQAGVSKNDKVINLIDSVYANFCHRIETQIKNMVNEIYFLDKLSSLKEFSNNEYLRVYQNRLTWAYDLGVNQNYVSHSFMGSFSRPLYVMYDEPKDLIGLILTIKEDLKNKTDRLVSDLAKPEVSAENLDKGLNQLNLISCTLSKIPEALSHLQRSSPYDDESKMYLRLEAAKLDFDEYRKIINDAIINITSLIHFKNHDNFELNALKQIFSNTQIQRQELEEESFNSIVEIREETFICNYSDYLSRKSLNKIIYVEPNTFKNVSTVNLKNLSNIYVNGTFASNIEASLNDLFSKYNHHFPNINCSFELNPIISKMISAEMFQGMLNSLEIQFKKDQFVPLTDLAKVSEIFIDEYQNLKIVLKMGCGYKLAFNSEEFFLAKRSFRISKKDLEKIFETGAEINFNDFKIVDYISPEVNIDAFEFHGRIYQNVIGLLLKKYSPTENWAKETAKLLFENSKPFAGIDDAKAFKDLLKGIQVDLTPVPLLDEDGLRYIVPFIVSKDFDRNPLLILNNEEIYSSFKPGLNLVNEAYAKIAAAFGEDPKNAVLAATACLSLTQAIASDLVEIMTKIDKNNLLHIVSWADRIQEIDINSENILTICYKAIVYEYIFNEELNLASGHIVSRKFQMPIAQLLEAITNNNPDLLINLIGEHKVSPSFLIPKKDQNSGEYKEYFTIFNSEEHGSILNQKEATELLANFK